MEVLFEFRGSRRPVCVSSSITKEILDELTKFDSKAALRVTSSSPEDDEKNYYLLQKWSNKWEEYVNVEEPGEIQDGDRLTAIPFRNIMVSYFGLFVVVFLGTTQPRKLEGFQLELREGN